MSQFDVYENRGRNREIIPYVLDVQADLISSVLQTRLVVPLYIRKEIPSPAVRIHVPLTVRQKKLLALFDELASVRLAKLGKPVANAAEETAIECKKAIDCIFFGIP